VCEVPYRYVTLSHTTPTRTDMSVFFLSRACWMYTMFCAVLTLDLSALEYRLYIPKCFRGRIVEGFRYGMCVRVFLQSVWVHVRNANVKCARVCVCVCVMLFPLTSVRPTPISRVVL
jgi:hypothetical protein